METAAITFPILGEGFSVNPPSSVHIFGFDIRFYGVLIALGFILAAAYALKRHRDFGLTQDNVLDMVICAVPSGIVGARIYYVIFNASGYFSEGRWLNIFKIWEGGLAVYGGVLGALVAVLIYSRVKKVHFGKMADIGGLGLFIGQAVGRWGNFFNREAFGAETTVPWRMGLTVPGGTFYVHPTFLYESLWNIIGFVLLHFFSKKHKKYHGQIFLMYVAWYGFGRYLIEGVRTDSLYLAGSDIRVSQLLAALSFAAAVLILLRNRIRGVRSAAEDLAGASDEEALPDNGEPLNEEQIDTMTDGSLVESANRESDITPDTEG